MKKIHARAKRKIGLGTHTQHRPKLFKFSRKKRAKTFSSEKAAKEYAESLKIKDYELKRVKKNKRFEIVKFQK